MNRRYFSKITTLGLLAMQTPLYAKNLKMPFIPNEELIGKGNPALTKTATYRLRPEAAIAYEEMKSAAEKEGVLFKVVSSYRNYEHQNRIWERKYKAYTDRGMSPMKAIKKIIEYSTIPGTSRHHWGTDIDIVDGKPKVQGDLLVPLKFHGTGPFCAFKEWMDIYANDFGFYLVYTDAPFRKGFKYEPWHYSYKPLSQKYLKAYQDLDMKTKLKTEDLLGSEHFSNKFMNDYWANNVLDINPELFKD